MSTYSSDLDLMKSRKPFTFPSDHKSENQLYNCATEIDNAFEMVEGSQYECADFFNDGNVDHRRL